MTHLILETKAKFLIKKLGPRAEDIADNLYQLGIKGRVGSQSCPLAVYLKKQLKLTKMSVGTGRASLGKGSSIELPTQAKHFIARFDGGDFSFLREDL